ncbi:efflux transporter outer membrane subunit [Chitinophaga sp. LS1]|uniref:efflux transporter outer membrane subunit n=1 Tax=Chitinophaga sp. LS1 TaxID=3051176 RepID=UPI002AABC806|nr:efflux transporter outer membrane subunit [Chitinophaga sp. LS1]WPV66192.1 efflux transporter outer membrane subunit [Chitinophaga sp. LS1]
MTKKYISVLTVFIAIIILAACRVGRDYKQPALVLPERFGDNASSGTSAAGDKAASGTSTAGGGKAPSDTSIAEIPWKNFFADTTLQRLIAAGLSGNYDLQLAVKRIEESSAYLKEAKSAWLPTATLNVSANTTNPSDNSLNGLSLSSFLGTDHIEDYSLNAAVSWEIDVWGKIRRQKEAALASYLETYEGAHAVQTTLVSDIANAYYNMLMLDAQLKVAKNSLSLSDTIVQMIRLQKTAGEVTELGVQQAISQQQTAALLIPQLEQALAIQENSLRILTGELPGTIVRSQQLSTNLMRESLPVGIPANLISKRPDVRAGEMALVAANAKVGVAQGSMYPTLTLTATGGLNAFKASDWFTVPASLFGVAAAGITQPLFQHRQLKTQLEVAKIQREEAVIRFRQLALDAVGEVSNSLVKLDKLKSQQTIASQQVETTQLATRQAQLLFRSGMANYLEVITAQGKYLQAELTQADITRQQLSAGVELYRSLGGGWN